MLLKDNKEKIYCNKMYCWKLDTCTTTELMRKLRYVHKEWQQCQFEINFVLFIAVSMFKGGLFLRFFQQLTVKKEKRYICYMGGGL